MNDPDMMFPSFPAVLLANHAGLASLNTDELVRRFKVDPNMIKYLDPYRTMDDDEFKSMLKDLSAEMDRLKLFQLISVTGDFDTALTTAFFKVELEDEQTETLKVIHKFTNSWTKGHVVSKLMEELENKLSGRDKASIADAMVEIMNGGSPDNLPGKVGARVKTFVMELTSD